MNKLALALISILALTACQNKPVVTSTTDNNLIGTWKLVTGVIITKGVPVTTDYTKDQEMIKVINKDHFAFLKHPTTAKPDDANKFDAGGGKYELKGDKYTEHLDFYGDKQFQGTAYHFTISFKGDTLIQQGKEGADRSIIEKYLKLK